jgi:hypothetical protein
MRIPPQQARDHTGVRNDGSTKRRAGSTNVLRVLQLLNRNNTSRMESVTRERS